MFHAKEYVKAESLEQAYELNQKRSNVLVGGMMWLKMSSGNRNTVIDLSGLGLDQIEETEDEFRIGCMCSLRQLELHKGLNSTLTARFVSVPAGSSEPSSATARLWEAVFSDASAFLISLPA